MLNTLKSTVSNATLWVIGQVMDRFYRESIIAGEDLKPFWAMREAFYTAHGSRDHVEFRKACGLALCLDTAANGGPAGILKVSGIAVGDTEFGNWRLLMIDEAMMDQVMPTALAQFWDNAQVVMVPTEQDAKALVEMAERLEPVSSIKPMLH